MVPYITYGRMSHNNMDIRGPLSHLRGELDLSRLSALALSGASSASGKPALGVRPDRAFGSARGSLPPWVRIRTPPGADPQPSCEGMSHNEIPHGKSKSHRAKSHSMGTIFSNHDFVFETAKCCIFWEHDPEWEGVKANGSCICAVHCKRL